MIANIKSADETTFPATLQVPSAHAIFPSRFFVIFTSIWSWSPGFTALRELDFVRAHEERKFVLPVDLPEH